MTHGDRDVRRTVGLEGGDRTRLLRLLFEVGRMVFGRGVLPEKDRLGLALSVD